MGPNNVEFTFAFNTTGWLVDLGLAAASSQRLVRNIVSSRPLISYKDLIDYFRKVIDIRNKLGLSCAKLSAEA